MRLTPKKSVPKGDIPPKLIKYFSEEFSTPLMEIINSSIKKGIWPKMWKKEHVTPVPKKFPNKLVKNLRSISGLMTFKKFKRN